MGSSGGKDPIQQVGNAISKGTQAIGNYYGFDNSGKWTNQGGVFHALDEGVGELTGRNLQRRALNEAGDAENAAQAQAATLLANQRYTAMQSDIAASNGAQAIRQTANASSGMNFNNSTPMAWGNQYTGGDHQDFLGL